MATRKPPKTSETAAERVGAEIRKAGLTEGDLRAARDQILESLRASDDEKRARNADAMARQLGRVASELRAGVDEERRATLWQFVDELAHVFTNAPRTDAQKTDDEREEVLASCDIAARELRERGRAADDSAVVASVVDHLRAPHARAEVRAYVRALAFNRGGKGVKVAPGESTTDARQTLLGKLRLAVSEGAPRKARSRRLVPPY